MKKILLISLIAFLFIGNFQLLAQNKNTDQFLESGKVQASTLNFLGKTDPLRDLIEIPSISPEKRKKIKENKKPHEVPNFLGRSRPEEINPNATPKGVDPLRQTNLTKNTSIPIEPLVIIEGMSSANFGGTPPDPAGDIGQDFYIQMMNATLFRIFDKDGNAVTPPTNMNTIWTPLGFTGAGDPIVLYDQAAQRWVLTEFANQGNNLLMAISETSDPQGSYFVYNFTTPTFPDYPKYGIWTNAYIVTTNEFVGSFYALERDKMLVGDPDAGLQRFTTGLIGGGPGFQVATPVDWDGILPPPADADPFVIRINDNAWNFSPDRLEIFTVDIDWETPSNSSFSQQNINTTPFDSQGCAENGPGNACIPQPSGVGIDGIPYVIMNRIQYRNFGDYEAIILNFMVDVTGTTAEIAGIRWMELRRTTGETWSIYQEGTFAPDDGEHRFMGGIAMDGAGNIGLAYSVSGPNTSPALRFTGRRANDPLGEMTIDEFEFATGSGSVTNQRFGDYSAIAVDPTDERTFWYTGEYKRPGQNWGTKIVAFKIQRDTIDVGPLALTTPQSSDDLTGTEVIEADFINFGVDTQTVFQVGYVINDGTAVIEDVTTVLLQDSVYHHVFTQTANLSELGNYNFKIFTNLTDDSNVFNDTLRTLVRQLPRFDAGITEIILESENICGNSTPIELTLTNFGTQTLTNVTISYQLNGGIAIDVPWTGALAFEDSETVVIDLMGLEVGTNMLTVMTSEPNGEMDEVPANDGLSREFEAMAESITVDFWMKFDFSPAETFWRLRDSNGDILYTGGPYINANPLSTITEEFCLHPDSCYTFRVNDLGGDGMSQIDGNYTLTAPDGDVLASLINPDFGFSESNFFCASGMCTLDADAEATNDSGVGNGTIIITPINGIGDLMYSINGGDDFQSSNVFDNLEQGEYFVIVTDGNGCDYSEIVEVMLGTPSFEEELGYKIEVFPNPTEGVFRINMEGLQGVNYLDIQILDATGKMIQRSSMARYNDVLTGAFALDNFADGVYFVRFESELIDRIVRVVKQ